MRFSLSFSRVSHFLKGLFNGRKHLVFPAGLRGAVGAVHHDRPAGIVFPLSAGEAVAVRLGRWAVTALSIVMIVCLLAVSCLSGCVPMNVEKGFGFSHPRNKATFNSRTGTLKVDLGKDNEFEATGKYEPASGAMEFTLKGKGTASSVVKSEGDRITESFVAARMGEYQLLAAQTQAMTELGGKALDLVGQIAPAMIAARAARQQPSSGGPNAQADALIGLLSAGIPGLDPATAAMLDEAVKEYVRIRSGQATPGPVVQP